MAETAPGPGWRVLLVGGHSGTGKSSAAREIGQRLGVAWLQTDDIRMALQRVCTPAECPALHFFISAPGVARPDVWRLAPEELAEGLIGVADVVSRALEPVIEHHLAAADPIVIEGDAITPALAARYADETKALRSVFLVEPDPRAVRHTMRARGPAAEQLAQAETYLRHGAWLRREAEAHGLPVLAPRPYATVADRVLAAAEALDGRRRAPAGSHTL